MSFRDNLQHLRATRNMTQEQLAMLLGVSRQSVTKWEAQKSYPEMDKLISICQIFNCTLDELVQGDLTDRAPDPQTAPPVPAGPVTDVCGYDEHMRDFARKIATGVALIIMGVAVGLMLSGCDPFIQGGYSDILILISIFAGIVAGCAFLIPAGVEHSAFVKAHPYIEDFYTETDKADARRLLTCSLPVALGIIFLGILCAATFDADAAYENAGAGMMLVLVALGVWIAIHASLMYSRVNIDEYNKSTAEDFEIEDIVNSKLDEAKKEALLDKHAQNKKLGGICGVIMLVATIIALTWMFLMPLAFGGTDNVDYENTLAGYFWLPWVIGGIICGIVTVIEETFGSSKSSSK